MKFGAGRPAWARVMWLPLVALLATLPLIVHGCSCGHDFDFHIVSWLEAAAQFGQGNLHPQWAFSAAWNAGEPRFVFYPPLSWTTGAVLGMVLPWGAVPVVYTWLALTGAGLACYRLLREFAAEGTAVAVAALYMVNPYMLFTAYERTAYAELLAAVFLPLLLHGILRERVTLIGIALPVTMLWLANAPAAVLGCYSLTLLAAGRVLLSIHRREGAGPAVAMAARAAGGTALGIGLAGFYIVPAAYQRRYVESALDRAQSLLITDNFLFHRTGDADHDAVLHTASWIAVGLLLLTIGCVVCAWLQRGRRSGSRELILLLGLLTVVIGFLLTALSTPLWVHLPELAFLQFPWRFLAMLAPAAALLLGLALPASAARAGMWGRGVLAGALCAVLVLTCYRSFEQACDVEDTVSARVAAFQGGEGVEPTDEYTANGDDNELLGQASPPFWLSGDAEAAAPQGTRPGRLSWPIEVTATMPEVLILNLRAYPSWRVTVDDHVETPLRRGDGLLAVHVPAGSSRVDLQSLHTKDQTAGWIVSGLSVAVLLLMLLRRRRSR